MCRLHLLLLVFSLSTLKGPAPGPFQTVAHVEVYIAGTPAMVTYAGLAPGFAGLYQVNAQIPQGTPAGDQTLQITAGGVASNTVTLAVRSGGEAPQTIQ